MLLGKKLTESEVEARFERELQDVKDVYSEHYENVLDNYNKKTKPRVWEEKEAQPSFVRDETIHREALRKVLDEEGYSEETSFKTKERIRLITEDEIVDTHPVLRITWFTEDDVVSTEELGEMDDPELLFGETFKESLEDEQEIYIMNEGLRVIYHITRADFSYIEAYEYYITTGRLDYEGGGV